MDLSRVALTDVGRQRDHNEDAYWVPGPQGPPRDRLDALGALYLVADGMGGHAAGEVASGVAVQVIPQAFYDDPDPNRAAALKRAIQVANAEILRQAQGDARQTKMGTTVVAAVIHGQRLIVAHAGDSRAYLWRAGRLRPLTRDHSWVEDRRQAGVLTAEEVAHHPMRNVVTRSLGKDPDLAPEVKAFAFQSGDAVLLCSDGLTGPVDDVRIQRILAQEPPERAVPALIAAANQAGGPDNVTAVWVGDARAAAAGPKRGGSKLLWGLAAVAGVVLLGAMLWGVSRIFSGGTAATPATSGMPALTAMRTSTPTPTPPPTPTPTPTISYDTSLGPDLQALARQRVTVDQWVQQGKPLSQTETLDAWVQLKPLARTITLSNSGTLTWAQNVQVEFSLRPPLPMPQPWPDDWQLELARDMQPRNVSAIWRPQQVGIMAVGQIPSGSNTVGIRVRSEASYTYTLTIDQAPDYDWLRVWALIDEQGELEPLMIYGAQGLELEWREVLTSPRTAGAAWFYIRPAEVNQPFWDDLNLELDKFKACKRVLLYLAWQAGDESLPQPDVVLCCDSDAKRCKFVMDDAGGNSATGQ